MKPHSYLGWETHEHEHKNRTTDWYWIVGLLFGATAIASFIFDNPIFGIFLVLAGALLMVHAYKPPRKLRAEITRHGVIYHQHLYPYNTLRSFWIHENREPMLLVLTSDHRLTSHIHIPIQDTDPDHIRDALLNHIDEARHRHTLLETLTELLEKYL